MKVVAISRLTEMFRRLVQLYAETSSPEAGELLEVRIEDEWQLFSDPPDVHDLNWPRNLLLAILEFDLRPGDDDDIDTPDFRGLFTSVVESPIDLVTHWRERIEAVFGRSVYYVPDGGVGGDWSGPMDEGFDFISEALTGFATYYPVSRRLYRARIHDERTRHARFRAHEMGAPLNRPPLVGRVNDDSNVVLYMASSVETALAEKRAWKGAVMAVSRMRLNTRLRILDLVKLPKFSSPFVCGDVRWTLDCHALLRELASECSRPVLPGHDDRHYLPSQQLGQMLRSMGFDGIAYPSAMGSGHNLVCFDPQAATAEQPKYYRVGAPRYAFREMHEASIEVDDWPYE